MSKAQSPDTAEKISNQRDALEDLAESDLPCADIANALLELEADL